MKSKACRLRVITCVLIKDACCGIGWFQLQRKQKLPGTWSPPLVATATQLQTVQLRNSYLKAVCRITMISNWPHQQITMATTRWLSDNGIHVAQVFTFWRRNNTEYELGMFFFFSLTWVQHEHLKLEVACSAFKSQKTGLLFFKFYIPASTSFSFISSLNMKWVTSTDSAANIAPRWSAITTTPTPRGLVNGSPYVKCERVLLPTPHRIVDSWHHGRLGQRFSKWVPRNPHVPPKVLLRVSPSALPDGVSLESRKSK